MMNLFERKLEDYLTVYKIPVGKDQLDPTVFEYSPHFEAPILSERIIAQIVKDLQVFAGEQPSRVEHCYLTGKIVKPGNTDSSCSLDVMIVLNKKIMDADIDGLLSEEILKLAKNLSGRLAVGTTHPINYRVTTRNIDPSLHNGIYDISNGRWLKVPNGLNHA